MNRDAYIVRREEIIDNAYKMTVDIMNQSEEVVRLFDEERQAQANHKTSTKLMEEALDSLVVDADYQASEFKMGPLAGIARTSPAYATAVKVMRSKAIVGELKAQAREADAFETQHRNLSIQHESAKTRLGAMRTVAELQIALLRVLSN